MFDYHVHTDFSADSKMPMEKACETALEMGVREIAFTEHLDYFYPNSEFIWEFDYIQYAQRVDALRKQFEHKLTILKAVEVGMHPSTYKRSKKFTDDHEFDFIIGSVHIVEDLDLHNGDYFKGKNLKDSLETYFKIVHNYVKDYQDFNVLGHLTLIKRYLHFVKSSWNQVEWEHYFDIVEEIFKILIESGRGIEINLSGFRYRLDCTLPNLPFVKLYKDLGGEIITIGTDAHTKHFVGNHLDTGYGILKEAGFEYITTFKERKPVFHKIDSLF
ncbi:histidinol-phosphatase HisJ family protein [Peribacillus deserti]|uniref:Histidinol-phosphatase n=1 Tax=Peribacillus deserti TaxID=673318 RepID=A0A2N5M001_9BACI|nr:histidinol-phosphatase HisJ family protein [Peribacillus deserti]PLT27645.1 histidinol phosphate phosphatase [Peribacillus deserti]